MRWRARRSSASSVLDFVQPGAARLFLLIIELASLIRDSHNRSTSPPTDSLIVDWHNSLALRAYAAIFVIRAIIRSIILFLLHDSVASFLPNSRATSFASTHYGNRFPGSLLPSRSRLTDSPPGPAHPPLHLFQLGPVVLFLQGTPIASALLQLLPLRRCFSALVALHPQHCTSSNCVPLVLFL